MAARGRVILCTIHQPSSELFTMFSQVLLLAEGKVAYMGSTNGALEFFTRLQFPCPNNFNPADHYILTLAIVPGKEEESRRRIQKICSAYDESHDRHTITDQIDKYIRESDVADRDVLNDVTGESRYSSSLWVQTNNLFWRSWTAQYRDDLLFWTRLVQTVVMAVMIGLIYFDLEIDQKGVTDINGAIFIVITMVSMTNMFPVLTSFPQEMGIAMREYGSGLYRIDVYFLTKTIAELPLFCVSTLIFIGITYWMIGLNDTVESFAVACALCLFAGLICVDIGYLMSVVTGDTTLALSITSPVLIPFMIFGGPFMNGDSVPDYFVGMEALSWFKYS
jgi:ABC-type multidrug transport system permease subunit